MNTIKGYVMCASTQRPLNRFRITWHDDARREHSMLFGTESEGFFEISLPSVVQQIEIAKDNYAPVCLLVQAQNSSYIAKLRKQ